MDIKWSCGRHKEDHIVFDTLWEAEEWADSIRHEMLSGDYNGYKTKDYKMAYALAYFLAESASQVEEPFIVNAKKSHENGEFIYSIWITTLHS